VLISVYGGSRWWGTDPRDKYNYSTLLEITAKNLAQAGNLPGQYFLTQFFKDIIFYEIIQYVLLASDLAARLSGKINI
jgi:hypothetical protein